MIYRCLVADDNLIDRELILKHLSKIDNITVAAICADGIEAAAVLAKEHIDLVFSDIDMPDLSGIGLKRMLKNPPVFVFITSHAEYAVESFNLDVVDFVVKPLSFERLYKAAGKAIEYIELKKAFGQKKIADLPEKYEISSNNGVAIDYFFIKGEQGITKLRYADVLYIESLGDYSKIFTQEERHVTLVNLKNLERQLPQPMFRRVHKQYIVNLEHIVTIGASEVQLINKQLIPISSSYRQEIINLVVSDKILSRNV